jgi:hypothetical protein
MNFALAVKWHLCKPVPTTRTAHDRQATIKHCD